MQQNDFWTTVHDVLRTYDLLAHPFYEAWTQGELTPEDLAFYGRQYLHHVSAFPTYLTALHCRLPDTAMRRAILNNAWEEEADGTAHADLWRQFAGAINPDQPGPTDTVLPAVRRLVESYREMAQYATPPTALGAFYAYEVQVPEIAEAKLAGLKGFYGAGDEACAYFELHRTRDRNHAAVWRASIDQAIHEMPGAALEVLDGVRRGARSLWLALDEIEAARLTLPIE
jgi:pyrroloquinoline-quinone synthase